MRVAIGGAVDLVELREIHFAAERKVDCLDVDLQTIARDLDALREPALQVRQERPGVVHGALSDEP